MLNSLAAVVCSMEGIRTRSKKPRNALSKGYITVESSPPDYLWIVPDHEPIYYPVLPTSKARPLILNSSLYLSQIHTLLWNVLFLILWRNTLYNKQTNANRRITSSFAIYKAKQFHLWQRLQRQARLIDLGHF